jgi:lipopolysaccharide transport system ATP-binding protein
MAALGSLCHRGILLVNGSVNAEGTIDEIVRKYVHVNADNVLYREIEAEKTQEPQRARLTKAWIESTDIEDQVITVNNSFEVKFEAESLEDDLPLNFSMTVRSVMGQAIFNSTSDLYVAKKGKFSGSCKIPENLLNYGKFTINILLAKDKSIPLHLVREVLTFEILDVRENEAWFGDISHQLIKPKLAWDVFQS